MGAGGAGGGGSVIHVAKVTGHSTTFVNNEIMFCPERTGRKCRN